ncbi:tRNA lysidine(34) synthetase TilS [Colwellia echini]|uniref:tRNA(Ile)-lysidine synthase n=1 Tax=Colwellia echini TaxID=1982103 RepID=A0ABY3MWR5_9GAMM|nr:tRNA lysidine(34) synthetase TilS [Colwellia echini]TYK65671.1 tRNA lysidine(34) synthetase TilS [Colwellia echini]
MDKLTSTLLKKLKPLFHTYGNIELIIAYSGGVDSQVLLHALVQLKQQQLIRNEITVCHVNHGLSNNAEVWQNFAVKACEKYAVKLIVKAVNVQAQAQQSLEALARDARYDALKSLTDKPAIILTGHHSDDQSETFLLALKRGSGLKGLSAMLAQTNLAQHLLVRPLLDTSRQEIEHYAKANGLNWVEDESNSDISFDRNFIRQSIMPLLRKRWPSINTTINRSAEHCLAGQELLDELAEQDLQQCKASLDSLRIDELKALSTARFNNLLRYFMAQHPSYHCLMPNTEQINQVRMQLEASNDKTPEVKVGSHFFRRFKNALYLTPTYSDLSSWQIEFDLFKLLTLIQSEQSEKTTNLELLTQPDAHKHVCQVTLPDHLGKVIFTAKNITATATANVVINVQHERADVEKLMPNILLPNTGQQVSISFGHNNPKCLPHFRQHSRSVKKVLQELTIPPWQRKRIAFLYYDNVLVSALGYFVCKPFIASNNQPSLSVEFNG